MNQTRDSITDIWGQRTPHLPRTPWPARVDQYLEAEPDNWVQSACVLCSNGCALDIGVKDGRIVGVRGRAVDRVNHGRLGPKGLHGWMANHSADRLTRPLIRRDGALVETTWEEAWNLLISKSREILDKHTANAMSFYTTGQLFIEEYYTLGVIGKAGLSCPHMDGNTRLCTATAAAALMETFGCDGQPASYSDIDVTDAIFHIGHNPAWTQTVLWMRILDRLAAPNPPKLVVVDPRLTDTARHATVHLSPKAGTNLALMNGILYQFIEKGYVDQAYVKAHTIGLEALEETVAKWSPERVEHVTGVPQRLLHAAVDILGTTPTLISTLLQGVYQSMSATATACQVNNMHLLRGLIGKPGAGLLQMNGQPTAQNTRECGANGELPGFRNWNNPDHVKDLARIWNIDPSIIPHYGPPTHAMEMFHYAEEGSIRFMWIICTNPAVSMPELHRIRAILSKPDLFVVVQDAFLTETAALADLVLPAAIWGEKTGTFTNTDRTVHISYKAVEPPGEAISDLDIFLEYARRMDLRDKAGDPLIKWHDPESAFEAWKECSRGRPCDYSGITYAKLTGGSGIQWPCTEARPEGTEHLYTDSIFPTNYEECEVFGHDLESGAAVTPEQYKAIDPKGKAFLKAADYHEPVEHVTDEYPLWLTTGRSVYHFHTRTKTARSPELHRALPEAYIEISQADAVQHGVNEGDIIEIESRRGRAVAPARIGPIEPGHLFMPFHFGYWDQGDASGDPHRDGDHVPTAANELTLTAWDPVSKQPYFKFTAVRMTKTGERSPDYVEPTAASAEANLQAPAAVSPPPTLNTGGSDAVSPLPPNPPVSPPASPPPPPELRPDSFEPSTLPTPPSDHNPPSTSRGTDPSSVVRRPSPDKGGSK